MLKYWQTSNLVSSRDQTGVNYESDKFDFPGARTESNFLARIRMIWIEYWWWILVKLIQYLSNLQGFSRDTLTLFATASVSFFSRNDSILTIKRHENRMCDIFSCKDFAYIKISRLFFASSYVRIGASQLKVFYRML